MKNIITFCFACACLIYLGSCQAYSGKKDGAPQDSVMRYPTRPSVNNDLVDAFFKDFQEKNDGWTKTEAGHKKLKEAFQKRMISDIAFVKACASYDTEYEYSNSIKTSESISPYSKDDGEEGEVKAFEFVITVALIKPLYNGQREISVKYEIMNTIPSTIEEHWRPYTDGANFCSVFDPYFKNSYEATLDLGSYLVTFKDEEATAKKK